MISLHFRPILCGQGEEWISEAGLCAGSFLRRLLQNSRSASGNRMVIRRRKWIQEILGDRIDNIR